ncbi:MAG: ATP-grasp domain-containing protein [Thermomicrobiales bacterium]|nr:ATP-grasp domain-containing protein [Thermomicrobiales bacterium]
MEQRPRVILLAGAGSYRCAPFRRAAERLGIDVIEAEDIPQPLGALWSSDLAIDYLDADRAAEAVAAASDASGASAILALDDSATLVAAHASERAGLPHNDPRASLAARDKRVMREALRVAGAPTPWFIPLRLDADLDEVAGAITYPCVVKPTRLSGSRGVIRANNRDELDAAFARVNSILRSEQASDDHDQILIEAYLPGEEVAVEGILTTGALTVLAIFDKPDPLVGPFFEETIYVTPSRHSPLLQERIHARTAEAAAALGIKQGPVHAELRLSDADAWVIEIAGRSIGGLCSTILEFSAGQSLEELILRNAIGQPIDDAMLRDDAAGVMMIPIPRSGVLKRVDGIDDARRVPGITGIEISYRLNTPIDALPEGAAYLGFIFARGSSPAWVESRLREAHALLSIRIDPLLPVMRVG